jgi:predicted N-acyltransferase
LLAVNHPSISYQNELISINEILEILKEIQIQEKPDVFFLKDMDSNFTVDLMKKFELQPFLLDMTMTLNIDPRWISFEDYLKSLSKKYKKRSEKILEAGKGIVRYKMNENEIEQNLTRIGELFENVVSKQVLQLSLIDKNYFKEIKKTFPETFSFIGYYFENKLVAFATYIEHNDELEIHYIGIDYNYNDKLKLYFNILLDSINNAIIQKKSFLELGRTAREAKANVGAKPVYFNDFIGFKSRMATILSKKLINYYQSKTGEQWINRHPFRQ